MAECERHFGRLDVLVNNAGTARVRRLEDIPEEDWYAAWELNVMAPMRIMRAALPAMVERGWGRVVNVASSAGKRPSAGCRVLGGQGRRALAFAPVRRPPRERRRARQRDLPGPTKSELWMAEGGLLDQSQEHAGHDSREQALAATAGGRPIGRLAESDEIAAAIVFLCSERASYVAGSAWSVDGGTVQVIL